MQAKKWTTFQTRAVITRRAIIMTGVIWKERFLWTAWSEKASVLRTWHLSKNLNQKQELAPLGQRAPGRGNSSYAKAPRWEELATKQRRRQGQGEEGQKKPPSLQCTPHGRTGGEGRHDWQFSKIALAATQRMGWNTRSKGGN